MDRHGGTAVLIGGACASIHSAGAYTSLDLDVVVTNQTTRRGTAGSANVLSVTDSCHDRLSLEVAMHIARRQKVTLRKIRQWSEQADRLDQFLVAPPGCEPGMEVVQTGRPVTRFVRKQAHIARSQRHARSLAVRTGTQEQAGIGYRWDQTRDHFWPVGWP